ncbi:MAG: response regulator [Deltaproteobacteria bacterium]|nr:response regulator [Deltaproteobacteria bacterium]
MNVLVVDQDASVLSSIVGWVQRWGYGVETSKTGREALRLLEGKAFDLLLTDTRLPDVSVQELILEVKALLPEMGIVTMTESNTNHQENEIRTLGIIYYMLKPINKQVLKDILDHVSRRKISRSVESGDI